MLSVLFEDVLSSFNKYSPMEIQHLYYLLQFTSDILFVKRIDNVHVKHQYCLQIFRGKTTKRHPTSCGLVTTFHRDNDIMHDINTCRISPFDLLPDIVVCFKSNKCLWKKPCVFSQKTNAGRHAITPTSSFLFSDKRFCQVHLDINGRLLLNLIY